MTWNERSKTFLAGAALSRLQRVVPQFNSGTNKLEIVLSGADTKGIGVVERDVAIGDQVAVKLFHDTFEVRAGGAVTAGSEVGPATSGKYTTAATTKTAFALTSATADMDIIEIAKQE
jgi:hypothetical protein